MATLQKIRTKAGLLVAIVIGFSLAAFVLGDLIKGGTSIFQRNQSEVGVIDGESIQYPDFQKDVDDLSEVFKQNYKTTQLDDNAWAQVREQAWQTAIRKIVMGDVYEELGIEVCSDELFDMLTGANPHQIVQQIFRNPETGQFDRASVIRFLKNLETGVAKEQHEYWLNLEKQIVEDRTQTKYINMVGKGLYVTSEQAQASSDAGNKTINFDYVTLAYNSVPNDKVTVTDKDLQAYYNKHKDDYKEEKSRKIEYITYTVTPSPADYKTAENWINEIKNDFAKAKDNVQFVNSNSDVDFQNVWYNKASLPENIAAWAFNDDTKVNDVFGSYANGDAFTLAKLHKSEMMPDSVQARHILLGVKTQEEAIAAQALADSLKTLIDNGADFAKLAKENSTDQGSSINGGDLGWFQRNQMVKPFEDAAFNNTTDSVTIVATQFGIHLIQTTKRGTLNPQVQVAYLTRNVIPSTKTYQNIYAKASKFAGENTTKEAFDAAVTAEKLTKHVANVSETGRDIAGLEQPRPLIKAAYLTEINNIIKTTQESPIFELGDDFVIAVLSEATEEGIASFDDVKARVELAVVKEKKTELLIEQANTALAGKSDLATVATALNTEVKSASNINFNSYSIPGIGLESSVIGTVSALEPNKVSKAIAGNNGVFLVMVTSENKGAGANIATEKKRLAQATSYRVSSQVLEAHRNAVEIEDKRAKFY